MAISLTAIKNELLPGQMELTGRYPTIEKQFPSIFEKRNSKMALERSTEMRYLGYAQIKNEGGATFMDNEPGERYTYNQIHNEIALGFAITRKAIDDNLYKAQFGPSTMGLMNSFNQTKEIYGASVLNTANVFNPTIGGDFVSLCNTAHPIDNGTIANRPTVDVDLNEATLLNGMVSIRQNFRDVAGLKIYARARKLIVPPSLEPVAVRLTKAELRPGTSDNDPNAIHYTAGGLRDGYMVYDYLTSPFAWFLLTDREGLIWMERVPYESDMTVEFSTDNLLVKGYERYSFAYNNWRSIWGSFPTS